MHLPRLKKKSRYRQLATDKKVTLALLIRTTMRTLARCRPRTCSRFWKIKTVAHSPMSSLICLRNRKMNLQLRMCQRMWMSWIITCTLFNMC